MVANIIRYRPKSAVRDVGKVLGFSTVDLERMARDLGTWWHGFEENLRSSLGLATSEASPGSASEAPEPGSPGDRAALRPRSSVAGRPSGRFRRAPSVGRGCFRPRRGPLCRGGAAAADSLSVSGAAGNADRQVVSRKELLLKLCREILDFPRHLSIHPGGFILGSRPIAHLVPVENATMPDRTVIQWDKYDVEAMNLFKVDLLGLGALSHLDHAMKLLKKHRGIDVTLADISAAGDDPDVYEALRRSDTVGVFQVESRAQMAMLPRMKPRRFYDLVIEISIVRPGPISGGMVHPYLRRRSGEEDVVFPHPSLEPVLGKTLGIPIFQEQVMKLAVVAADYSPGEADQLRRDMAAWRSSTRLARHREKLITRMVAKGIAPEFAEAVYSQIQGFGEYGFPESHAASFALIAYATAWFKVKYPAFFSCGLLNAWPMGFYSPATLVEDARHHGITVLPVDVTRSGWNCSPEWIPSVPGRSALRGGESKRPDPGFGDGWGDSGNRMESTAGPTEQSGGAWGIRMGLRYVKGLSRDQGRKVEILRSRGNQAASVDEFASLSGLDQGALKALALTGAFSSLAGNRRSQLWHTLGISGSGDAENPDCTDSAGDGRPDAGGWPSGTGERWNETGVQPDSDGTRSSGRPGFPATVTEGESADPWAFAPSDPLDFTPLSPAEEVSWDYSSSLHSTRGHPLEGLRDDLRSLGLPDSAEVREMEDGGHCRYAGVVICRQRPGTANGVIFLTLEDETGFVNLVVWDRVYQENRNLILSLSLLGVEGRIQSKGGTVHLIVERCFAPPMGLEAAGLSSRDFR